MAKETMLTYLDQRLKKKITAYDTALDWDRKNHTIEILVRLFAENRAKQEIDDIKGVVSEEEVIEFEDGILLYDANKAVFDEEDYLAVLPFEGKKGVTEAFLAGLVEYLQTVLDEGQSDLLGFLADDSKDAVFELKWDAEQFAAAVASYSGKKAETFIGYPSY